MKELKTFTASDGVAARWQVPYVTINPPLPAITGSFSLKDVKGEDLQKLVEFIWGPALTADSRRSTSR